MSTDNRSLTWYLICRTAVITLLLGGAAVFFLEGSLQRALIYPLFILIAVSFAEALVSAFLLKKISNIDFFAQLQIAWDLLFVSALILLTGGVESVFSFAYLLVIVAASFLLSRRLTILAAAGAIVLFGGILDLQYFGYLHSFGLSRSVPDGTFFSTLFVHAVAFFLGAILSGTLAERWRRSEAQLQRKSIDYAELEKMNRTILAHINSGLMLVNQEGRIRSFNRAATEITGLSLQEVYNQPLPDVFTELVIDYSQDARPTNRAEVMFSTRDGGKIILGYATTPAKDRQGVFLGTLITFQDLTQLKKIEDELKRADRLAAVGRLAAAMAHEIRNPLASISGSVQILRENTEAENEERQLMDIVVSEADRLSGLLTSFLQFARPKMPDKGPVDMSQFLAELVLLFSSDNRFANIDVEIDCPPKTFFCLDQEQLRQVFWDLAINAVDAMEGSGRLGFRIDPGKPAIIRIEDSGPGIPEESRTRIFEPFFSTKGTGSGLGLASVYAVMEAHGGDIKIERGQWGGACFSLHFPDNGRN